MPAPLAFQPPGRCSASTALIDCAAPCSTGTARSRSSSISLAVGAWHATAATTLAALPGVLLFWWMMASGLVDRSLGSAGTEESRE